MEVNEFSTEDHEKLLEMFTPYWTESAEGMGEGAVDLLNMAVALQ